MKVEIYPDEQTAARRAAEIIGAAAREAVLLRGRFLLALSGGATPERMLRLLAEEDMPWNEVHLFQVDERVAGRGSPDRNLTELCALLVDRVPLRPSALHPMPVEEQELAAAASRYGSELRRFAGVPPVLDLVHLGLGADGHTASLFPEDAALNARQDVAVTNVENGRRRMTLTRPVIDLARSILFLVAGNKKTRALSRLREGDPSIPAGRIRRDRAIVVADAEAAGEV